MRRRGRHTRGPDDARPNGLDDLPRQRSKALERVYVTPASSMDRLLEEHDPMGIGQCGFTFNLTDALFLTVVP